MTTSMQKISAIILAGGQARRFNFQDKGLIHWQGKPLIQHVIDRLQDQTQEIIINANRNIDRYRELGYLVCSDQLDDFQGPLAGIQAALPLTNNPLVLVSPCDTALLPSTLVSRLVKALEANKADIAYPYCDHRAHYLPVLLRASLLKPLNEHLKGKDRSMKGWYHTRHTVEVNFDASESSAFSNFNQPENLLSVHKKTAE